MGSLKSDSARRRTQRQMTERQKLTPLEIFYEIRVCENPACGLRYPLVEGHPFGTRCPVCLSGTRLAATKALPAERMTHAGELAVFSENAPARIRLHAVLDNIRSAWNVGAMFRTADGLGVEKLYLCGITPTPENTAVQKTALGAEQTVAWEYARDAVQLAERLKEEGFALWGLEQDARALCLEKTNRIAEKQSSEQRVALVVGNEVTGVDPALLDLCEQIFYIPMRGQKRSLNVEVAFAIAAWALNG